MNRNINISLNISLSLMWVCVAMLFDGWNRFWFLIVAVLYAISAVIWTIHPKHKP